MEDKIRLGVSSCLLGDKVRYDGGHKHDRFLTQTLGKYVDFVAVCPEVECGLGVPRERMHLEGSTENPHLVTSSSRIDHTEKMLTWVGKRVRELEDENLDGFIFKSKSPSCGMTRVGVVGSDNQVRHTGVGLFAGEFMKHFPLLPVEEDGRLHDIGIRENFIERIFVHQRWRNHSSTEMTRAGLVQFHTSHKLLIMAHSEKYYQEMGRMVAHVNTQPLEMVFKQYEELLTKALRQKATVKQNVNVLLHMLGYFSKELDKDEKQEMIDLIRQYGKGNFPLIVPITLFNHYIRKYNMIYLAGQYYLEPHPLEMKLRNHV